MAEDEKLEGMSGLSCYPVKKLNPNGFGKIVKKENI